MSQLRVRPTKPASALAAFVGVIFVVTGISTAIYGFPSDAPWFAKAFIALWTFLAAAMCFYHCANVFSARGVPDEIIDVHDASFAHAPEQRLRQLSDLRGRQLITEDEYQERRRTIVNDL